MAKKLKKLNGKKLNLEKEFKKFNLEHSVAGGLLRTDFGGYIIDLDKIKLLSVNGDYLIHIQYYPKEKKSRFSAYGEKE